MKRFLDEKYVKRNREGSSLVSVIIGIAFLAALGLTILTVSNTYLRSVIVNNNSTDNFYDTESILQEVRTGLLEYAGDASEAAYKEVMEEYATIDGSVKQEYNKKYIELLVGSLKGTAYTWDDSNLELALPCNIKQIKGLTKKPKAITSGDGVNLYYVIHDEGDNGYSVTIKDLVVDYKNEQDYRSRIKTDIKLKIPDYKFEGDSTFEELKDYIVICDDALEAGANKTTTNFTGKVYTGNHDTGILIADQSTAVFNSETIISRGQLQINSGADVTLSGENSVLGDLWLPNIYLKRTVSVNSGQSTKLNINENSYIANDLNIEDNNAVVTLAGKYYGYSYNEANTATTDSVRADYSSAILVNGKNTTIKTDTGLQKLILAGRTFVSRQTIDGDNVSEDSSYQVSDIMMGESLAVKSNQIVYMVPDKYIAVGHNPITANEKQTIYTDVLKEDFGAYLDDDLYTENFVKKGKTTFRYLYLKFKSEKKANEYFADAYKGEIEDESGNKITNKSQIDDRAQTYIATNDAFGMKLSPSLYLLAGNIVHNYYDAGGSKLQTPTYYDGSGKPIQELLDDGKKMGVDYVGYQKSLLASGNVDSNKMRMTSEDLSEELVKDKIINFSKITTNEVAEDPQSGGAITLAMGDYTVSSSTKDGIVVAGGDVKVTSDFKGLILAKGKVYNEGNVNLQADMVLVGNLMEFIKSNKSLAEIFRALDPDEEQNETEISKCISFNNWTRDE